jgi:transcriptional regulator with XRE-family HTH domain
MDRTGEQSQLADAIDARRLDMDLTWRELATLANISATTFDNIRAGRVPRARTRRRIEDALSWSHGSINRILSGGEPTMAAADAEPRRRPAPDPLTASTEEIIEFLDEVREVEGEDAYRELLAETLEVQRLAARKPLTSKEHEEL